MFNKTAMTQALIQQAKDRGIILTEQQALDAR